MPNHLLKALCECVCLNRRYMCLPEREKVPHSGMWANHNLFFSISLFSWDFGANEHILDVFSNCQGQDLNHLVDHEGFNSLNQQARDGTSPPELLIL